MMRILARLLAAVLFLTLAVDASAAEAATRPSAPRSVKATPGISSVKVSWAAPASNGGATIDRYAVQRRSSTTASWVTVKRTTGSARSWTNTGLTNGRRYYFRVIAHNRRGNGTPSATVSAVPRTVPSSPRTLAADTRLLSFSMGWQASLSNGGARIDFYLVEISKDGATWTTPKVWKTDGSSPVPLFTGLTAGTQYWFRIRAHNAAGYSVSTGAGPYRAHTTTNPVTDPVAQAGDGQVSLTWTKPTSNLKDAGIPAASTYEVDQSSDGGTTWTLATETENTSAIVTELTNGTAYLFRVRSGTGITNLPFAAPSPSVAATPMGAPTVPRNVALVWDPIAEDYALTWAPPANDGGKPLTGYQVEYWTDPDAPDRLVQPIAPGDTEAPVAVLALDHHFRVRACNGPAPSDCGPWSDEIGPIPGQVTNATINNVLVGLAYKVALTWQIPANNDVAPTSSYTVWRSSDAGVTFAPLGSTAETSYDDLTAEAETPYVYRVVAVGTDGSGQPRDLGITTEATPVQAIVVDDSTATIAQGGSQIVDVSLAFQPTSNVTVFVDSDDTDTATVSPSILTFTPGNWNVPQSVTINGVAAGLATISLSATGVTTTTIDVTVENP